MYWYVQRAVSQAVASQEFTSMLQLLRFALSLYLLKGLPWSRCPSFSCPYSSIFEILSDNVSRPSQLALEDQALNAGEAALLQDLEVGHSVLPLDVADLPQTSLVKLLQLLDVPVVGGPRLAAIEKRAQDPALYTAILVERQMPWSCQSLFVSRRRLHSPFQSAASPQHPGIHCP